MRPRGSRVRPRSRGALLGACLAACLLATMAVVTDARAQDLEPRAYSNAPVDLNFLLLGYVYSAGDVSFDSSSPIKDASLTVHASFLAYARTLDLWGRAGKVDVVLPYAWLSGTAKVGAQTFDRDVWGLGDPRVRISALLYGGPALTLSEFADYKSDLIVGVSLAVTAPL